MNKWILQDVSTPLIKDDIITRSDDSKFAKEDVRLIERKRKTNTAARKSSLSDIVVVSFICEREMPRRSEVGILVTIRK